MRTTSRRLGLLCAITLTVAFAISVGALLGFRHLGEQIYAGDDLIGLELAQRDALIALVDEENGVRAYIATGDERFLDIYAQGRNAFMRDQSVVESGARRTRVTPDASVLQSAGAAQIQAYFVEQIALVAHGHREDAIQNLTLGKILLDRYRRVDNDLQRRVLRAALVRTSATRTALHFAVELTLATLGLLGLLGFAFVPLVRSGAGFERDALRDSVTMLGNRRAFFDRLSERCGEPKPFAVALIDLDGFKAINDTLGHATGDRVLHLTGQRLRAHLRVDDFAARLGGDEFALLLDGVASPQAGARTIARLCASIEQPSTGEDGRVAQVGASAGLCYYPTDTRDAAALLAGADKAMYAHKRRHRRQAVGPCAGDAERRPGAEASARFRNRPR